MYLKKKTRIYFASMIVSFYMVLLRHGMLTAVKSNWLLKFVPKLYGWEATTIRASKMEERGEDAQV
jgi:hypothetical protein